MNTYSEYYFFFFLHIQHSISISVKQWTSIDLVFSEGTYVITNNKSEELLDKFHVINPVNFLN